MKRFVLLVFALVFSFTTAVIAADKTIVNPEKTEKISDVRKSEDVKKSEEDADQKAINTEEKVKERDGQKKKHPPT